MKHIPPEELEKAKAVLNSPKILEQMVKYTEEGGHVGEEVNKKMLYLGFTSRKMNESISFTIKGASASGKNVLVNSVLRLMPQDEILSFSYITSKSLMHFEGDLSHKILFIAEHSGSESANYAIRTSISEGEISILLTVKDEITGNFKTIEKRIPAKGLVFCETTTRERVHPENQTRYFDLFIDESQKQTERILKSYINPIDTERVESERRIWQALQSLLEPHSVYIPFMKELTSAFPTDKVRVRRDFPRFLALISAHTLLYQYQRKKDGKGKLIATVDDLIGVLPLAQSILIQSYKELSPKLEKTLKAIGDNFEVNQEFTFGELEEKSEVKDRTLRNYLRSLVKGDYLSHNGKTGRDSRYALLSNIDFLISSSGIFNSKLSELLKKYEESGDFPQNSSISSKAEFEEDKENRGKNYFSSKDDSNDRDLHQKKAFEEMRKEEQGGVSNPTREILDITNDGEERTFQVIETSDNGKSVTLISEGCQGFEEILTEYERAK